MKAKYSVEKSRAKVCIRFQLIEFLIYFFLHIMDFMEKVFEKLFDFLKGIMKEKVMKGELSRQMNMSD